MSYIDCHILFDVVDEIDFNKNYVMKFLSMSFNFINQYHEMFDMLSEKTVLNVAVKKYSHNYDKCIWKETVIIKESKSIDFNLYAKCDKNKRIFWFDEKDTLIDMTNNNEYEIYISEKSIIIFIEFIRGLIFKILDEEGLICLHAAAVYKDDNGIAIIGAKGDGKTTLLFDYLTKDNWAYVSGDKVFLVFKKNKIMAYGFPDYPYIGVGTIKSNCKLNTYANIYNIDLSQGDYNKILIDFYSLQEYLKFEIYKKPFCLSEILIANINSRIIDKTYNMVIKNIEFYNSSPYANWIGESQNVPNIESFAKKLKKLVESSLIKIEG